MIAWSSERQAVKIRLRGRHTSPSQVEKVAVQAGKAAPAVAIAGALVAAPQVQHALASPGTPASGARQAAHHHTASGRAASAGQPAGTVTLDSFSASSGNSGAARTYSVPLDPPAHYMPTGYQPRHARPAAHVTSTATMSAAVESRGTRIGVTGSGNGLWQINASNGALATLNPYKNAQSVIILSGDGRNWDAWTTYTSGAYYDRC